MKISYHERFKSYGADTISILIITKGHNSINIVRGVTVLILCVIMVYLRTKFGENILKGLSVWTGLDFITYYYKGA